MEEKDKSVERTDEKREAERNAERLEWLKEQTETLLPRMLENKGFDVEYAGRSNGLLVFEETDGSATRFAKVRFDVLKFPKLSGNDESEYWEFLSEFDEAVEKYLVENPSKISPDSTAMVFDVVDFMVVDVDDHGLKVAMRVYGNYFG